MFFFKVGTIQKLGSWISISKFAKKLIFVFDTRYVKIIIFISSNEHIKHFHLKRKNMPQANVTYGNIATNIHASEHKN